MLLLYNLPTFCMAAIVVGATLAAALLGYVIFRRCAPIELNAEQRAMTISMVSVITTINSLLVAFAAISVWDAYNDANRTVAAEAACAGEEEEKAAEEALVIRMGSNVSYGGSRGDRDGADHGADAKYRYHSVLKFFIGLTIAAFTDS